MKLAVILLIFFPLSVLAQKPHNEGLIISSVNLKGNDKTKRGIILREMEVSVGDTVTSGELSRLLDKSKSNLLNTQLFNFVRISEKVSNEEVVITIEVTEQWYSWIFPIFEIADRNFNEWWETKDFSRVDYGLLFIQENFRGRSEFINFRAITGFNEYLNFKYSIPYLDKNKRLGLELNAEVSRRHETRVITQGDKLTFYNDDQQYPFKKYHGEAIITYRPGINNRHSFSLSYDDYTFQDTLMKINPDYLHSPDSETAFISFSYKLESDYRDYDSYPLHGHYLDFTLMKNGLGLIGDEVNYWQINGEIAKYWQLDKRFYFASSIHGMFSGEKNHPYFLNKGLGYGEEYVRSYEYNVINGNAYGLMRSNFKYTLIPIQTFTLDFIPLKQFRKVFFALYLNVFADAGYVDTFDTWRTNGNRLPGRFLLGKGVGLDLVTYYEKVLRLEYSWNRQNKGGFFIHFRAPI